MSRLEQLIHETHRRSLWQVRTRARHRSLLACVSCLALTVLACGRGDDTAYSRGSTVIISYCCGNEALNPSHDINQILRRDMPVTFFFPRTDAWVAHRRIRGFRLNVPWNALALAEELWIEEEHR